MRETIDFGIDLGTTNSAIAVFETGAAQIVKNNESWDYTPSAVWMPRKGLTHVGRKARERVESDPDDAYAEFKLQMGLADADFAFRRAGVRKTAEQLSAEVLKSLCRDAAHELGEPPAAAVITVPAAFALNQSNATGRAAALAGLGEACPLIHEPNAAALAYGVDNASESAHWMVFDLGGGTFDSAVMSRRDGELQLLQHAGDPHLGGKNIDWAIVDELLAPAAARDLDLPDFTRGNSRWRTNFAKLKAAAEAAKIELSRAGTSDLFVDLRDQDGEEQSFTYTLTRGVLDDLALPYYLQAIKLCRTALADSALRPDHIDRLLLVGGATLSPTLRELLTDPCDGLGIPLDHTQDPTTVVARGAAVYAASVRAPTVRRRPIAGEFTVELHYEPQSLDTTQVPVGGTLHSAGQVDWTQYSVSLHNTDGSFHSLPTAVSADGGFYTTLTIAAGTTSRFTVELTDATGVPQKLRPDSLSLTHTNTLPAGPVLTHSLGIGKEDGSFAPIVRRGAALPAGNSDTYHTTVALTRAQPDAAIHIPLLEGEEAEAKNNQEVGKVVFRRSDLRYDLPEGSEVEVTYDIRTIGQATAVVETMGVTFEAEVRLEAAQPEHADLVADLRRLQQRTADLEKRVRESKAPGSHAVLKELSGATARLRTQVDHAAGDKSLALECARRLRAAHARLDDVEREAIEAPRLMLELGDALAECEGLLRRAGGQSDRQELERLRRLAGQAMQDGGRGVTELERLLEQARELCMALKRDSGQLEYDLFDKLVKVRFAMSPRAEANALIARGRRAVAARDRDALAAVLQELWRLLPEELLAKQGGDALKGGLR